MSLEAPKQAVGDDRLDDVFELLGNERRRHVIALLTESPRDGEMWTLGDLAEEIAAVETGTSVSQLSSQQRRRVYISLYQGHLPTLDGAGVIDYDDRSGDVVRGPEYDRAINVLDAAADAATGNADDSDGLIGRLADRLRGGRE
jgi:hypothetical protein